MKTYKQCIFYSTLSFKQRYHILSRVQLSYECYFRQVLQQTGNVFQHRYTLFRNGIVKLKDNSGISIAKTVKGFKAHSVQGWPHEVDTLCTIYTLTHGIQCCVPGRHVLKVYK